MLSISLVGRTLGSSWPGTRARHIVINCGLRLEKSAYGVLHDSESTAAGIFNIFAGVESKQGGDTEEEGVKLGEVAGGQDGVVWLGGSVHLLEDLRGEGLSNPTSHGKNEL